MSHDHVNELISLMGQDVLRKVPPGASQFLRSVGMRELLCIVERMVMTRMPLYCLIDMLSSTDTILFSPLLRPALASGGTPQQLTQRTSKPRRWSSEKNAGDEYKLSMFRWCPSSQMGSTSWGTTPAITPRSQ